jgi:hypothetical protein
VVSGVVEVVALLGSAKGGFRDSSAARAVVNQVTAAVEDEPSPTTRRHQRPTRCDTELNIDAALMTEELKCSTYA